MRKLRSRSPSNWSTVSTRCSSARGPASDPSLVTWPISSMVTSRRLATSISAAVASRTAPTLPGVESPATSVCTESITQTAGRSASIVASTAS